MNSAANYISQNDNTDFILSLNRCGEEGTQQSPHLGETKTVTKAPSCSDLTQAYKVLSDQLLGKDKELAVKSASNFGTGGEQAEWFLLAISSYKMKKYGECLFAVSKTARRNTVTNQVVIDISD